MQQGEGALVGVGASASAAPVVPSGVTLIVGPSSTAPAASGGASGASGSSTASGSGASTSGSGKPSGAVPALGFNSNFLVVLVGLLAGGFMVL